MLKNKIYICEICKTKPDQISHHKKHLETQKHKDKRELFELKLGKLTENELKQIYNTTDIKLIIEENETNTYIKHDTEQKKLNNLYNMDNEYKYIEMSAEDKLKIDKSQNVSNKEALRDKIHEIHNYLRNNGAGYGMNALKVFNLIYGLKKLEEKNLLDKVNLKRPQCEFSYFLKLANEEKDEELDYCIRIDALDSIHESEIKHLLFYEIPKTMTGKNLKYLVKEINKISIIEKTCNVLLSGKIYEYFIGRDESAISELGAYFTDRHIVEYIYQKLDPSVNSDNSINSMIDMFGGSGGFTTGYINYLNNKYNNIDWKKNIDNIFHYDMNEDVVKSAGLEIFCLTGELPNMKDNMAYRNSFTSDFIDSRLNHDPKYRCAKYKYVITNPPYGGDKINQTAAQIKRKKIKDFILNDLKTISDELTILSRRRQLKKIDDLDKQEKIDLDKNKVSSKNSSQRIIRFCRKYDLSANDKEACSLILMMDMVDDNGTCIGVLKEGVFFNKTYKDIRKCLVQNFNVREIISVPQDQFENTSTKTSIIIFDNSTEKTTSVKFSELIVHKFLDDKFEEINDEIVLTQNKNDISHISDNLIAIASIDDIINNPICSLNGKDYNKKVIVCGDDYELKKLGDMCNTLSTTKHTSSIGNNHGKYRFYCSSQDKELYVDFCEVNEESIIIGQGGQFNIHYDKNFTPSKHVCVLQHKEKNYILLKYLYYIIPELQKLFITNGSVIGWLNKTNIKDLNLPIPKDKKKIKYWVDKISKPFDNKNNACSQIKELEDNIKNKIKHIVDNEDCDEVELGSICKIKYGTRITKKDCKSGNIPVYGGGDITFYTDTHNREKNSLIVSRYAMSKECVRIIPCKFFLNDSGLSVHSNNENIQNYINYYFLIEKMQKYIYEYCTAGSIQQNINMSLFKNIKIKIPKDEKLIKELDPLFEKMEKLQTEMRQSEKEYQQYIKELSNEAIPNKNDDNKTEINYNEETEDNKSEEKVEIKVDVEEKKEKKSRKKEKITYEEESNKSEKEEKKEKKSKKKI